MPSGVGDDHNRDFKAEGGDTNPIVETFQEFSKSCVDKMLDECKSFAST